MKINLRLFSPCQLKWLVATTLGLTAGPLWFTTAVWGQTTNGLPDARVTAASPTNVPHAEISVVPQGNGEIIADIQLRVVGAEDADTQIANILQTFQLQPGDVYDPERAQTDLTRLSGMANRVILTLEPAATPGHIVMVVTAEEPNSFFYGFGSLPRTTTLPGPLRPSTVSHSSNSTRGFALKLHGGIDNIGDNNQRLTVGLLGGENAAGAEVDFRQFFQDGSGYGVNFQNRRGVEPEFEGGDTEVDLANGDEPWVHRLGGGVEYFRSFTTDLDAALGVSYQRISVRDDVFTNDVFNADELGNSLTVDDSGQDDLLMVSVVGELDRRNDADMPTTGYRLLLGADQSIPIGAADILFNRLSANYTQFVPLDLFGFTAGPRTLVLNVQGGTIIGDTPPYEAFSLGGSNSVRGYSSGELGTGESFVQATAEYRFPMFSFSALDDDIDLGGTLFFDYGSDLGTGDDVIGEPAEARDKPGDGFGYGVGVRALTSIGALRLEFGISDQGDSQVIFKIGDRF